MNNQVRITYNPYEKTIGYEYRSNPDQPWMELDEHNTLANKYQHGSLQNYSEEIVQAIVKDFCSDGKGVDLFFRGTAPDWEDLKKIVCRVDSEKRICCCDGESAFISAENALSQIDKIFKELSEHLGTPEDSEIKCVIDQYLDAVRPEIVLVVSGTYSAGKSTFINALIGEELLPTSSDPMTAKVFKISSLPHGNWQNTVIRFQYAGQNIQIRFNESGYYLENSNKLPNLEFKYRLDAALKDIAPSPAYVYHILDVLNTFNGAKERPLVSDFIEIETPFFRSTLPLEQYRFTIYDTPGSESANHQDHLEILTNALEMQTNGIPVFITEPDDMDKSGVAKLRGQLSEIKALDESNILIVINKSDEKGSSTLSKIKDKQISSAAQAGAENRIFLVSSLIGLGAKKDDMSQCVFRDLPDLFDEKQPKFAKGTCKLYSYDILPSYRYEEIVEIGDKVNKSGDSAQILLHNSGLYALESEIARFAEKYAAYNKAQQAQKYLSLAIAKVKEQAELSRKEQTNLLDQITKSMDEKKQVLIHTLAEKCEQMQQAHSSEYIKRMRPVIEEANRFGDVKNWKVSLQEQWRSLKKNEAQTKDWINSTLSKLQETAAAALYSKSHAFWKMYMDFFKKKCVEIVTESKAFTESENKFLKQYILTCPQPEFTKISFDFEAKAKKSWHFLFWHGKEFDLKTCAENIEKEWTDDIARTSNSYLQDVQSTVKIWYEKFIGGLVDRCADFNPDLRDLVKDRKVCEEKINNLLSIENTLVQKKQEIIRLFQINSEEA